MLRRRSQKTLRRKKKKKRIIKHERRSLQGKSVFEANILKRQNEYDCRIEAPKNLSFLDNPQEVVTFIEKLEECLENKKTVFVILKKVKSIDYGGVTVLLSVMIKFNESRIKFNGDFPEDLLIKNIIINSGFFDHFGKKSENRSRYTIGRSNQILTHAEKNVTASIGLPIMEEASRTIWGEKKALKGLQRALLELMQNTNNHAVKSEKGEKHWWLSVNHDEKNKVVSFVFMDHGIGIFSSLYDKPRESKWYKWEDKMGVGSAPKEKNNQLLKNLLEGTMHATVTGESFRGKGIPALKEVLNRGQISGLHVITNNVFANVDNDEYLLMSKSFNGTFYYWEIDVNSNKQEWTIE